MRRILQQRVLFLLFVAAVGVCWGQSDTARLEGTVTDPQGAAVAGASVTVTNTGTSNPSSVTTNELANYTVTALPPGH